MGFWNATDNTHPGFQDDLAESGQRLPSPEEILGNVLKHLEKTNATARINAIGKALGKFGLSNDDLNGITPEQLHAVLTTQEEQAAHRRIIDQQPPRPKDRAMRAPRAGDDRKGGEEDIPVSPAAAPPTVAPTSPAPAGFSRTQQTALRALNKESPSQDIPPAQPVVTRSTVDRWDVRPHSHAPSPWEVLQVLLDPKAVPDNALAQAGYTYKQLKAFKITEEDCNNAGVPWKGRLEEENIEKLVKWFGSLFCNEERRVCAEAVAHAVIALEDEPKLSWRKRMGFGKETPEPLYPQEWIPMNLSVLGASHDDDTADRIAAMMGLVCAGELNPNIVNSARGPYLVGTLECTRINRKSLLEIGHTLASQVMPNYKPSPTECATALVRAAYMNADQIRQSGLPDTLVRELISAQRTALNVSHVWNDTQMEIGHRIARGLLERAREIEERAHLALDALHSIGTDKEVAPVAVAALRGEHPTSAPVPVSPPAAAVSNNLWFGPPPPPYCA